MNNEKLNDTLLKASYESPSVRVINVIVEKGFALSDGSIDNPGGNGDNFPFG